jgi:hypothetical protein
LPSFWIVLYELYFLWQGTILIQSVDHLFSDLANLKEDNEEQWQELDEQGQKATVGWI